MKRHFHHSLLLILLITSWANAQVPVVDAVGNQTSSSNPSSSNQSSANNSTNNPANNDIIVNMYLQLEALQQEMQNLRGVVDEQSFEIRRLQSESRDRYLDIDRRLSTLNSTSAAQIPSLDQQNPSIQNPPLLNNNTPLVAPLEANIIPPPVSVTPVGNPAALPESRPLVETSLNEQELYTLALNTLLEKSDYDQSITLFQQYIDIYPEGRLLVNAYYWQGEALILVSRYTEARNIFTKILGTYPDNAKAPAAFLKLVVANIQLDNMNAARQALQDLILKYPDSATEIRAAQDYLRNAE